MRRFLAYLLLLILPWVARGQAVVDWYYWFDQDSEPRETGSAQSSQFQLTADVSDLDWGVHTLYVQIKESAGIFSTPYSQMFFNARSGMQDHMAFHYWFDCDKEVHEIPYGNGRYSIDVSELTPGFHLLNCFVTDGQGIVTDMECAGFFRSPVVSNRKVNYWFNGDSIATQIPYAEGGFSIDISHLPEGLNTIIFQMDDNAPTDMMASRFIKVPQTEGAGDMTLLCIIDGEIEVEEKVSAHEGAVKCDFDVSHIEQGLHKAMFQLVTPTGTASSIAESYFIRTVTDDEVASMQCCYTIDGFYHKVQEGTCANGAFHFDLPVEDLEDGLHRLDYMLVSDNGITTSQGTSWFIKTPVGGNAITRYDYWLNDNDTIVTSVMLEELTDPFQLVKLLPVDEMPIRSSCFHFENVDGQPKIFAKNDIHFRFHDKAGRWVDESRQYIDYRTSLDLNDITELKPTQTFVRPEENGVRWFKFKAEFGDTIALKSNLATSLQVFAPSGKEILSTMGDKSVQFSGAHTWERGTFYVAVHDVTGTKNDVTLDYMHMDKYDVVSQDVRVVGNGGCSTITFQGNGFRDLYAVDLKDSKGNIIKSIDVGHESDATTTVTFDFSDSDLGKYDAEFHFTGEDKRFDNIITVEEAKEIVLSLKDDYSSSFLRGSTTTHYISITNHGNVTAYNVPVEIQLIVDDPACISSVKAKSPALNSSVVMNFLEADSLCEEIMDVVRQYTQVMDKWDGFVAIEDKDHNHFLWNLYSITVPPSSTVTIDLDIKATDDVQCEAVVSEVWPVYKSADNPNYVRGRWPANAVGDWICCYKQRIECVMDGIDFVAGFTQYGCAVSFTNMVLQYAMEVGCDSGGNLAEKMENVRKSQGQSFMQKVLGTLVSCLIKYYDDLIGPIKNQIANLKNETSALSEEISNINKLQDVQFKYIRECETEIKNQQLFGNYVRVEELNAEIARSNAVIEKNRALLAKLNGDLMAANLKSANLEAEIGGLLVEMRKALDNIYKMLSGIVTGSDCFKAFNEKPDCPPNPEMAGGTSTAVNSLDPNEIVGYQGENGSMFVSDNIEKVHYTIYFENDSVLASAAAQNVYIVDTIDTNVFDLPTFEAESFGIVETDYDVKKGQKEFVKVLDMRPMMDMLVQVSLSLDEQIGIARWHFATLDPMTVEPVDDMRGFLLPNDSLHSGEGKVSFSIALKKNLPDFTLVSNHSANIFDFEEPVLTNEWINIVDNTEPVAEFTDIEVIGDTLARLHWRGYDNASGAWKYSVHVQAGALAPWYELIEATTDSVLEYRVYPDIDYGFCVLATDSAYNRETELKRKAEYTVGQNPTILSSVKVMERQEEPGDDDIYDLSGRKYLPGSRQNGIVIQNKRKRLVR